MIWEFNYFKARRIGYLSLWEIEGVDKDNNPFKVYIDYLANKPEAELTYIEAENVKGEVIENCLYLLNGKIIKTEKGWIYDPDHPRNLAKSVTVK